jgi:hypothetical protein
MRNVAWLALALGGVATAMFTACGSDDSTVFDGGPGTDGSNLDSTVNDTGSSSDGCTGPFCTFDGTTPDSAQSCTNLCLKQVSCPNGADGGAVTTTISGTVYDPADQVPLYNVAVYVPNAPLSPLTHGATCDQCGATLSGDPLVSTLTDAAGHFVLQNVPVDSNVPLVMQIGKWRRRITIPTVTACVDNPITDKTKTRLATKPGETSPDDDIPYIALTTGGADALECLPLKIGIDPGQFTNLAGAGRVTIYQGNGGATLNGGVASATSFWANNGASGTAPLKNYDMVMLGCEGSTFPNEKPSTALQAMQDYANIGGRVFGTHYHYYWIESSPAPWPGTATWNHSASPTNQTNWPVLIDMTFPKGQAFAQWMLDNGGSTTLGTFPVAEARHDVDAVNQLPTSDPESTRWVYTNPQNPTSGNPKLVEYYSFNTPVYPGGVPDAGPDGGPVYQCGKVVFSDLHVSSGNLPGGTFPQNCVQQGGLTPQEKALEFLLFDLSSCIQNDSKQPPPPGPR